MRYARELDFPIEQGLEFRLIPKMIASLRCFRLILRYQALAGFIFLALVFYISDSHFLTLHIKCKGLIYLIQEIHNSHFKTLDIRINTWS